MRAKMLRHNFIPEDRQVGQRFRSCFKRDRNIIREQQPGTRSKDSGMTSNRLAARGKHSTHSAISHLWDGCSLIIIFFFLSRLKCFVFVCANHETRFPVTLPWSNSLISTYCCCKFGTADFSPQCHFIHTHTHTQNSWIYPHYFKQTTACDLSLLNISSW